MESVWQEVKKNSAMVAYMVRRCERGRDNGNLKGLGYLNGGNGAVWH
jgi:hypothetical protein